jgi:hypothetical protein
MGDEHPPAHVEILRESLSQNAGLVGRVVVSNPSKTRVIVLETDGGRWTRGRRSYLWAH